MCVPSGLCSTPRMQLQLQAVSWTVSVKIPRSKVLLTTRTQKSPTELQAASWPQRQRAVVVVEAEDVEELHPGRSVMHRLCLQMLMQFHL